MFLVFLALSFADKRKGFDFTCNEMDFPIETRKVLS